MKHHIVLRSLFGNLDCIKYTIGPCVPCPFDEMFKKQHQGPNGQYRLPHTLAASQSSDQNGCPPQIKYTEFAALGHAIFSWLPESRGLEIMIAVWQGNFSTAFRCTGAVVPSDSADAILTYFHKVLIHGPVSIASYCMWGWINQGQMHSSDPSVEF